MKQKGIKTENKTKMSQIVLIDMDTLLSMIKDAVNAGIKNYNPNPNHSENGNVKTLTRNEVATILKCTPNTVTKYIKQGKLEATPLNGQYRISEKQLQNFLNNKRK